LLNVQQAVFQLYSGEEQFQQYIKIIQKWERDKPTGATNFDCHWKSMKFRLQCAYSFSKSTKEIFNV